MKIFKVIVLIVMIIYAFYGMACAILAYVKFSLISGGFNNIIDNWDDNVITDVRYNGVNNATCPPGYANLMQYSFPGTAIGCNCRVVSQATLSANNLTSSFSKGACNANQTRVGC